jgi:hypothetical protein
MTIADAVTTIAAFWGAVLSTIVAVRDFNSRRPRIRIREFYQISPGMNDRFTIRAENIGIKTIMLNKLPGLNLLDGIVLCLPDFVPDDPSKCYLQPGASCSFSVDQTLLARALIDLGYHGKVKYRASVTDELGIEYLGEKSIFNTDHHMKQQS